MISFDIIFFYFLIYSFLGWILEGVFNLCTQGTFVKPNFLLAPLKPMYGIASVLLVLASIWLPTPLFLIGCLVIPSAVEYLTAFLLFHLFGLTYWDYHQMPYQLSGYICLRFSLYWFFLSLVLVYLIHPLFITLYLYLTHYWMILLPIVLVAFIGDTLYAIMRHLPIKASYK